MWNKLLFHTSNYVICIFREKNNNFKRKETKLRSVRYFFFMRKMNFWIWPWHRGGGECVLHELILFQSMQSTRKIWCLWMCGEMNFIESKLLPFSETNFSLLLYISCVSCENNNSKLFFLHSSIIISFDAYIPNKRQLNFYNKSFFFFCFQLNVERILIKPHYNYDHYKHIQIRRRIMTCSTMQ